MKRFQRATVGLTFAAASFAGCGESTPTYEARGQITHFAQGEDAQIVEDQWVYHEAEVAAPTGEIRNLLVGRQFTHCEPRNDQLWSFNTDDGDCSWLGCGETDGQYCEAQYIPEYTFERLEEVVVLNCPADLRKVRREFKSDEKAINTECLSNFRDGQRVEKVARFVLWFRTKNPVFENADDKDKPKFPEFIEGKFDIDTQEWVDVERTDPVYLKIRDSRVVDASLEP